MPTTYRSAVGSTFSIGAETAPGSGGTANTRLPILAADFSAAGGSFSPLRPSGNKYVGVVLPTDYWSEAPFRNASDFNSLPFLVAGGIGYVAPTGTTAKTWLITPTIGPGGVFKTYVVQDGMTGAVATYRNVMFPDMTIAFKRDQPIEVSGQMIGRKPVYGASLTSPTNLALKPMSSIKAGIFLPTTFGDFSSEGTRIDPYVTDATWFHTNAFDPFFVLDDSVVGPAGFLEGEVDCGGTIAVAYDVLSADTAGPFTVAKMEAGTPVQFRMKAFTVEEIESGVPYSLYLDVNAQVSGPPTMSKRGNLKVLEWPYICIPESTTGLPFKGKIVNSLASI